MLGAGLLGGAKRLGARLLGARLLGFSVRVSMRILLCFLSIDFRARLFIRYMSLGILGGYSPNSRRTASPKP